MTSVEFLVGEGWLDTCAGRKILEVLGLSMDAGRCIDKRGKNAFWRDVAKYDQLARKDGLVVALTDLDDAVCPSALIAQQLQRKPSDRFLLRIAARKLESWLLADATAFARRFAVPTAKVPAQPDMLADPKQALVNLARMSRLRSIVEDVVPESGMSSPVGKGYSRIVEKYIFTEWDPLVASERSPSLARAIGAIRRATA